MRIHWFCVILSVHGVGADSSFICSHLGVMTASVCLDNPVGAFAARYNRKQYVASHFPMWIILLEDHSSGP